MAQKSFYPVETFDLAQVAVTYTAAGLAAAKFTAGIAYYTRLDLQSASPGPVHNFVSALWSKGSGTAGTAYLGLYSTDGTKLYLLGATANLGAVASGSIRQAITVSAMAGMAWPLAELYVAFLVATDSGTLHLDNATSTAYAANPVNADPTGGGGLPRAFFGAGTALTTLPGTELLSGVTASGLLLYAGVD